MADRRSASNAEHSQRPRTALAPCLAAGLLASLWPAAGCAHASLQARILPVLLTDEGVWGCEIGASIGFGSAVRDDESTTVGLDVTPAGGMRIEQDGSIGGSFDLLLAAGVYPPKWSGLGFRAAPLVGGRVAHGQAGLAVGGELALPYYLEGWDSDVSYGVNPLLHVEYVFFDVEGLHEDWVFGLGLELELLHKVHDIPDVRVECLFFPWLCFH